MLQALSLVLLVFIASNIGYIVGHNDGFDIGVQVGHADNLMKKNGCEFRHNGVKE